MASQIITTSGAAEMSDTYYVYARTLEPLMKAAEIHGLELSSAFRRVSFGREDLKNAQARIPWEDFIVWCEEFERLIEPLGGLDEVGRAMEGTSYARTFGSFVGFFAAPRWLFYMMERWFGPSLFPMVETHFQEDDGELWVQITFPKNLDPAPIFYRICRVIFAYAPVSLGMKPAYVEVNHEGTDGIFRIIPPPSTTLFARLKRAFKAIVSTDAVIDEVVLQHDRLLDNYRSLQLTHDELEATNQLLEASRRRFALAMRAGEEGLFEIDPDGTLAFASPRALGLLGLTRQSHTIEEWRRKLLPADVEKFDTAFESLRDGSTDTLDLEVALELDDEVRHLAIHATCDGAERNCRVVGSLSDITERIRQTARLERSEQRFRTLIEHSPQSVLVFDKSGKILFANEVVASDLSYSVEELQELSLHDIRMGHGGVRGLEEGLLEVLLLDSHQEKRIFEMSTVKATFDEAEAFMAVGRDITEQRDLQARLQEMDRMIAVGTLAAGVAHEINNPLAYIQSNVEFSFKEIQRLVESATDEEEIQLFTDMQDALNDSLIGTRRVRDIVRDLKGFSHEEADTIEPVDIEQVVVTSVNMAWHEVQQKAVLETEFQNIPAVAANESRMGQVLLNLIVNAAQAVDSNDPNSNKILIRTYVEEGFGVVEIRDTGSGMPEEVMSRIFDPFFTTKAVGEGTGLGLSISRNTVRRFGGTIRFESEVGVGTTCRVRLPLADLVEISEVSSLGDLESIVDEVNRSILVIDDDVNIGAMMQRILASNYTVVYMQDGRRALDHLEQRLDPFDLIICDQMMPGMSGSEVYEKVVENYPPYRERFALMTGGVRPLPEKGPPVLSKPFGTQELRDFLRERFRSVEVRSTGELDYEAFRRWRTKIES